MLLNSTTEHTLNMMKKHNLLDSSKVLSLIDIYLYIVFPDVSYDFSICRDMTVEDFESLLFNITDELKPILDKFYYKREDNTFFTIEDFDMIHDVLIQHFDYHKLSNYEEALIHHGEIITYSKNFYPFCC